MLFTPGNIGNLQLANRLVRSATAERMATDQGYPLPPLAKLYQQLADGGVGLIITGHMFINPSGKCHAEMTGISSDDYLSSLTHLAEVVHNEEGKIAVQINHGGANCAKDVLEEVIAPSAGISLVTSRSPLEMTQGQIQQTIDDFASAAFRVLQAGFDAVQIHSAHGYLNSQFLSPLTNKRQDEWGGSLQNRSRFLKQVCLAVRTRVGDDFPVLIKFGIADGVDGGLTLNEGLEIISNLKTWGIDGLEISSGFSGQLFRNIQKDILSPEEEGYFLEFLKSARKVTTLPILAVGGYRSRQVMEKTLQNGHADFISMCRPLIREPRLPLLFKTGEVDQSDCLSANLCWAEKAGEGISCKCYPEN
jgi:2,4-dienoyl-CoA reductase-like NADH-dependent reductase (Old Yellow Enzyme family)